MEVMGTGTDMEIRSDMSLAGIFGRRMSIQNSGILRGSVDSHSHILFGVDDGVAGPEESMAVLAYEASLGVREVWCTPHVMEDMPNTTGMLRARFSELCSLYSGPVRLRLAAEYMLDALFEERFETGDILTMDDDMVLVETSAVAPPYDLDGVLGAMIQRGYRPLLAHPERYLYMDQAYCQRIHRYGVRFQLNIASLTGYYGTGVRQRAEFLLKRGLYFAYGSDCHRADVMRRQYSETQLSVDILRKLPLSGTAVK